MRKILSGLLAGLFLATSVFAAEKPYFYTVKTQDKGLNTQSSEYILPENQAGQANNVRFNGKYGAFSKRPVMTLGYTFGSAAINGLHRFYRTDGTKKTIGAGSTKLYVGNDTTGAGQVIKTGLTDGKQWQFVTYKNVAIGMNGFDKAIKYDGHVNVTANTDGHRTDENLVAELGAPFAELNTGSNLDASSWYMYKIAFYNGSTYQYSTARSNAILTGAGVRDITLTDIPLGPVGTTQRIIYRTSGAASKSAVEATSTYYRVATISDNSTRTYNDAIADATIEADTAPTWATVSAGTNVTPPTGSLCTIHKEKLFVGWNRTSTSNVYWSETSTPDYFHPNDYRPIREDDGDSVSFLKVQLGMLIIGKQNSIQKLYTEPDDSDDWIVSDTFSTVGCVAPYTASNSTVGIIYLGRDGLYAFTGQSSMLLSDPVKPVIDDILATNINSVWGFWYKNEYHMAYTSAESGETTNNRVLVFDTVRMAYNIDTKEINTFGAFSSGDDFGVLYMGSSAADGKVWANETKPAILNKRLKAEFNEGTYDDTAVSGEENDPLLELGWDITTDNLTGITDDKAGITDRPDTDGTWVSPVYEINASALDLLYWNEQLISGDVTFQIRTGATTGDVALASYSSAFTNPNGSDVSGVTAAKYIQFRINMSTTVITTSPNLFVSDGYLFKMTYSRAGTTRETAVLSEWSTGFTNLGLDGYQKSVKRIKVFYTGTAGTATFTYMNERGTASRSFTIDLSKSATESTTDPYTGNGNQKVYTHFPATNTSASPFPVCQFLKMMVSENGTVGWNVDRIEVMFYPEEITNA